MKQRLMMVGQCKWWYIWLLLAGTLQGNAQADSTARSNEEVTDTVAVAGATDSKDTAQNFFSWKGKANQPYSTNKIGSRVPADKEVAALKGEDDFWYVKSIEKFKSSAEKIKYDKATRDSTGNGKARTDTRKFSQENYNISLPAWLGTVMWGIIIMVFLFAVVYFLLANKINIFSRSSKGSTNVEDNIEAVDLFKIPYHDLLQKAYAEKNYRLAVRILYLQTLKLLSEKNIILFQADYTNMDYLQQLSQTTFYKDFFAVTRHYEYVWYGGFVVSEPAFGTIQNDFATIQNKILHR